MILAIETSSNVCGISLVENGKIISDLDEPCHREHNEMLPLLVQSILKKILITWTISKQLQLTLVLVHLQD